MTTKYIRHPNPLYRGNPLIEGLGLPLLKDQLVDMCTEPYVGDIDLSDIDPAYHSYYKRTAIDNLIRFHEPRDELYRIYDIQRRMVESGLEKRNPITSLNQAQSVRNRTAINMMALLNAVECDLQESKSEAKSSTSDKKWIKSINVKKLGLFEVDHSYVLCGLSGAGKTTLIEGILNCENQLIVHDSYLDASGTVHPFRMKQIYKVYVKVDNRKGQKSTLLSMLESIDAAVDENYSGIHKKSDIRELIAAVRKASIIHGIGLIIFDEAQNLSPSSSKDTIGANERVSMKFLEEIFNHIAIPTFFIGTFSLLNIFSKEMTISRRVAKDGSTLMASCAAESPFWDRFCKIIFQTQFMDNQRTEFDEFKHHIHYLSAGLPAIAVSVVRAALNYLTFMDSKNQDLSIAALDMIYKRDFEVLHAPIKALRSGQYGGYEDFEPMYLLDSVETVVKAQFSKSPDIEKVEKLLTGNPKLKKQYAKAQDEKKQQTKIKETSDKLSPASILGDLGFGTTGTRG